MSVTEFNDGKVVVIDEYSLNDYVLRIQEYVQKGYVVGPDNNHYPTGFSGWFRVGMVKEQVVPVVTQEEEIVNEIQPVETTVEQPQATQQRRGRAKSTK